MNVRIFVWLVLCFCLHVAAAGPIEGTMEEFRNPAAIVAKGVAKILRSRSEESITVGSFNGPPNLGSAAGAGLKQLVVEELKKENIRVEKLGTALGLSGEYRLTKLFPEAETRQVQLEVKITDETGQVLTDLASSLEVPEWQQDQFKDDKGKLKIDTRSSDAATAVALGLSVDFDREFRRLADNADLAPVDLIKQALEDPTSFLVNDNELRASRQSPYGLQVIVAGRPRELTLESGRPFVSLEKGESFQLRFLNDSSNTMSTVFTLDGINSFTFSNIRKKDGNAKYSQWIVRPGNEMNLKGWHVDNATAREFKLTDFSESAAALVSADTQLGVITVVARATWAENESRPEDEPRQYSMVLGSANPGAAIGFGDEVEQQVQEDIDPREYGRIRAVLSIRYDRPENEGGAAE